MIKTKELRIGNYVCIGNSPFPVRVTKIFPESVCLNNLGNDENNIDCGHELLSGIPLNKEWFIKFGFRRGKEDSFVNDTHRISVVITRDGRVEIEGKPIFIGIEYIHQLQNLYFALAQKELGYFPN